MLTLQDIAAEAGVSKMTVSNVINGNYAKVSKKCIDRVKAIIQKHGYVPNSSARSLAAKSSRIIAGIIAGPPDANLLTDGYVAQFFGAVSWNVQKHGYYFMLRYVEDYHEVTSSLRSWSVDGAIFIGMSNEDIARTIKDNSIPLVFTDSYTDIVGITNIGIDDRKGGSLAAEYLIARGHQNMGFITYSLDGSDLIKERLEGYRKAIETHGLSLKEENIIQIREAYTAQDAVLRRLIGGTVLQHKATGKGAPTAYFTTADKLAMAFIKVFHEHGMDVPADVSIIGFDNLAVSPLFIPGLTTISQDINEKAKIAVDTIFRRIKNPQAFIGSVIMDVALIERESVKSLVG